MKKRIGWDFLFLILIVFLGFIWGGTLWATTPKIAAGGYYSLALKSDGTLWAWGDNSSGQLGNGTFTNRTSLAQIGTDNKWGSIAAGGVHSLALKSNGTLWAWGYNNYGQLGDGTTTKRTSPFQIGTGKNWVSIAAGSSHSLALKSDVKAKGRFYFLKMLATANNTHMSGINPNDVTGEMRP